jgi:hypothetical protein
LLSLSGKMKAGIQHEDSRLGRGKLNGLTAELRPISVRTKDGDSGEGALRLNGSLAYSDFSPRSARARMEAAFPDAEPLLEAAGIDLSGLPKVAAKVLDLSHFRARADVSHDERATDIRLLEARTDAVRARGRWHKLGKRTRGAFVLELPIITFGLRIEDSRSETELLTDGEWLNGELRRLGLADSR